MPDHEEIQRCTRSGDEHHGNADPVSMPPVRWYIRAGRSRQRAYPDDHAHGAEGDNGGKERLQEGEKKSGDAEIARIGDSLGKGRRRVRLGRSTYTFGGLHGHLPVRRGNRNEVTSRLCSMHATAVIRIDVAAFLVKVDLAALLAHVDLELARGTGTLPAVVAVTNPVEALAGSVTIAPAWRDLGVQIATQAAAKVRDVFDWIAAAEQHDHGDEHEDDGEIFGLDGKGQREHEELLVGKEHGEAGQQAEERNIRAGD